MGILGGGGGGLTVKDTSACGRGRDMLYIDTSLCSHQSPPYLLYILPWTRDRPGSIQVIASRGILDDIPPPIYHP